VRLQNQPLNSKFECVYEKLIYTLKDDESLVHFMQEYANATQSYIWSFNTKQWFLTWNSYMHCKYNTHND
jgi:hypothetical protein